MSSSRHGFANPVEFAGANAAAANCAGKTLLEDPRPAVALPGDGRLLSEFAGEIGSLYSDADAGLFRRGDLLVVTPSSDGRGLRAIDPEEFRTFVEKRIRCFRTRPPKRGESQLIEICRTMSRDEARGVIASPQFLEKLPVVEVVNDVPLPLMRQDGGIELLSPGYDSASRTLTMHDLVYPEMTIDEARGEISDLLGEFRFACDRSRSVAVAAMVSVFAKGLLPAGALRPAFVYLANMPGAGKTTAADCAVVPVFGRAFRTPMPDREEELGKTLLAAVIAAQPVIFFDNVHKHLASAALEGLLSSNYFSGRVLSASQMFSGPNLATIFITGNGCTVSRDMERRSLFCELFSEHARPEERVFTKRLGETTLLARRDRILGALWQFVRYWDENERPPPSIVRAGYEEWAESIGAIVEHTGFGCPLETARLNQGGDVDSQDVAAMMRELFREAGANNPRTFSELVAICSREGLFERFFAGGDDLDRVGRARLARLLASNNRIIFPGNPNLRFCIEGRGNSRKFRLEVVDGGHGP